MCVGIWGGRRGKEKSVLAFEKIRGEGEGLFGYLEKEKGKELKCVEEGGRVCCHLEREEGKGDECVGI